MEQNRNRKPDAAKTGPPPGHSRRSFLKGVGAAAGATVLLSDLAVAQEKPAVAAAAPEITGVRTYGRAKRTITLKINGKDRSVKIEPRTSLLEALREGLGLVGSKEVCSRGSCGACTALVDGVAVCSCLYLAIDAQGKAITTIEGIADDPAHAALIQGYLDNDGAQCGYCIPGFVVRSAAFLKENSSPTPEQIRHGLAGNICRCGTYTKIFDSVAAAAKGGRK